MYSEQKAVEGGGVHRSVFQGIWIYNAQYTRLDSTPSDDIRTCYRWAVRLAQQLKEQKIRIVNYKTNIC
jgi:hypothetical protein